MENLLLSHFRKLWKIRNQVHNKSCNRNLLRVIIYEMRLEREAKRITEEQIKNKA